jgi:hypothetical protein
MSAPLATCSSRTLLSRIPQAAPATVVRHRYVSTSVKTKVKERSEPKREPKHAVQRGREFLLGGTSRVDAPPGWATDRGDHPARAPADLKYIRDIIDVPPYYMDDQTMTAPAVVTPPPVSEEESPLMLAPGALMELRRGYVAVLSCALAALPLARSRSFNLPLAPSRCLDELSAWGL